MSWHIECHCGFGFCLVEQMILLVSYQPYKQHFPTILEHAVNREKVKWCNDPRGLASGHKREKQ
jgi:hypothetical protein